MVPIYNMALTKGRCPEDNTSSYSPPQKPQILPNFKLIVCSVEWKTKIAIRGFRGGELSIVVFLHLVPCSLTGGYKHFTFNPEDGVITFLRNLDDDDVTTHTPEIDKLQDISELFTSRWHRSPSLVLCLVRNLLVHDVHRRIGPLLFTCSTTLSL